MNYLEQKLSRLWLNAFLYLIMGFALYYQVLDQYFFADDISILSVATPLGGASLLDCLLPLDIGFWRPIPLTIAWVSGLLFGASPLVFHLIPFSFHLLNGFLVRQICRKLNWSTLKSFLTGLLFLSSVSAWPAVSMMQNVMDVLVGTSVLLMVLNSVSNKENLRLPFIIAISLLGFFSKETGVLLPMISVVLWFSFQEKASFTLLKLEWKKIAILFLLTMLGIATIFYLQAISENSYTDQGRLSANIFSLVRKFCDAGISVFFPFLHIIEAPFVGLHLPHTILKIARLLFLFSLIALLVKTFQKQRFCFGLLITACILLVPSTLLTDAFRGRYLYASIAPVTLMVIQLISVVSSVKIRAILYSFLAALGSYGVIGILFSPSIQAYQNTTDQLEQFMNQAALYSGDWAKGDHVSIYNHPYPATDPYRWTYAQQLMILFLPEAEVTLLLDHTAPTTDKAYIFKDGELQEIEIYLSTE